MMSYDSRGVISTCLQGRTEDHLRNAGSTRSSNVHGAGLGNVHEPPRPLALAAAPAVLRCSCSNF